jgi:hypothetical protein
MQTVLASQADILFECAQKARQDQPSDLNLAVDAALRKTIDLTFLQENLDLYAGDHCKNLAEALLDKCFFSAYNMIRKALLQTIEVQRAKIINEFEENPNLIHEVLNNG